MIERLFASATMYATLAMFFDFPGDALHARLIARSIGRDVKCVLRQLQTLEACRIGPRWNIDAMYEDGDPDGIDE
jgi:hypothetical protein